MSWLHKILGDPMQKTLKQYYKLLEEVKKQEEKMQEITSLEQVQAKTAEFRDMFAGLGIFDDEQRAKIEEIKNSILPEAFALHKRACEIISGQEFELENGTKITWNMVPYDVQMIGAMTMHYGDIAEMKTGEGKTLVATIAAYLNALAGYPVHIVTVNDYLAKRDALEMGVIYNALGLTTGVVYPRQDIREKKEMYLKDVVYATNNELGFDYLRDNMVPTKERQSMSPLAFAIIDEVDSILVDEARTPLIISAPDNEPTGKYLTFKAMIDRLHTDDYKVDEKAKTATLTEKGITTVEKILGISNIFVSTHYNDLHHIENALRARIAYKKDIDYIVRDGQIMIIDEHTGRVLAGRRYSNGLHQALEAKEGVDIKQESKTLASITFQNYFRLYKKLAGMTGTAKTEEEEFQKIYNLDVIVVPTNKPIARKDNIDLLFKNESGKFEYLVNQIEKVHKTGQPILVGTVSVEKSERISDMLRSKGVSHEVLNAKQDSKEAEIVGKAGQHGAVTIATNMAGRGTDIKLDKEALEAGGLYVIGTEKHETRRIDNQLRGRSGRQGDVGETVFMVSPEDDIMRIFGGERLYSMFNSPLFSSYPTNEPLMQSKMLTRNITGVQKQIEGRNFDMRKHILEYDDILDEHRKIIYSRRNNILQQEATHENEDSIHGEILSMIREEAEDMVRSLPNEDLERKEVIDILEQYTQTSPSRDFSLNDYETLTEEVFEYLTSLLPESLSEQFYEFERLLYLQSIDELWMLHIDNMAGLREKVAFAGYAQKNPLLEYKQMAYELFGNLIRQIRYKTIRGLMLSKTTPEQIEQVAVNLDNLRADKPQAAPVKQISKKQTPKVPIGMMPPKQDKGGIKKIRI